MSRLSRARAELPHPEVGEIDLLEVLHALSDPTRMKIAATLRETAEQLCGTFAVDVAPSTLSHHFRVLREAGVIAQQEVGTSKLSSLRRDDLDECFPGLLDAVLGPAAVPV